MSQRDMFAKANGAVHLGLKPWHLQLWQSDGNRSDNATAQKAKQPTPEEVSFR